MALSTPDTPPPPRRRNLRRRFIIVLIPVLLFAVGWRTVERLINIERYRPVIDEKLEQLLKLPLTFGAMDLQVFPTPRLVVANVTLGEADFAVSSPQVTVTAHLMQLFRKQLALQAVEIHEARVQLPSGTPAFRTRWSDYMRTLGTPAAAGTRGKPMLKVTLETIEMAGAQVFRGQSLAAEGKLSVSGVTAGAPDFSFTLQGTTAPNLLSATGRFTLNAKAEPLIQGTARLNTLSLTLLTGDERLPDFMLDADLEFTKARQGATQVLAGGQVRLKDRADALGPFELTARYESGELALEKLFINSAPLSFQGSLQIHRDRRWSLSIAEATLRNQGITWLVERLPGIPLAASPGATSEAVLRNVHMGNEGGTGYTFTEGTVDVTGMGLRLGEGGYVVPGIQGAITVTNNTYQLNGLSNGPVEASGTVAIDYMTDSVALDLAGQFNLGPDFPLPESAAATLRADAGTVTIPQLQATIQGGAIQLASLKASATMEKGAFSVLDKATKSFSPITGVQGEAVIENGAFHLKKLATDNGVLSATITPDETLEHWAFSGRISSDLSNPLWKVVYPSHLLTVRSGKLECTKLEGVFTRGQNTPPALELAARIQDLTADIHTAGFADTLVLKTLTLSTAGGQVSGEAEGRSGKLGPISARGSYTPATGAVDTLATLRPLEAGALPPAYREGLVGTMLSGMGALPLRVQYDGGDGPVTFSSAPPTSIQGTLAFAANSKDKAPISLSASAALPTVWLAPLLASTVEPVGAIKIDATLTSGNGKLGVRADLDEASFGWSALRKPAGFPLAVELSGGWGSGGLKMSGGHVKAGSERVDFTLANTAVQIKTFAVALAPLLPLLPEGVECAGTVSGSFVSEPLALSLNFEQVRTVLAPDIPPVELQGAVSRQGGGWRINQLSWAAGESRGTLQASESAGVWNGRLEASRINVNELTRGYRSFNTRRGKTADDSAGGSLWDFTGHFEVACASVAWVDAVVDNARCVAEFTPAGVKATNVSFAHGPGKVTGQAAYTVAPSGVVPSVTLDLNMAGVGTSLLEGLFTGKASGLAGLIDGRINLAIPLTPGSPSLLHGTSGEIEFKASDGTLGKAGLASKLLAALRTTDLLRLRVPQLKDKGLSFKTLSGRVVINAGVFRVDPFSLADSAYVLEAKATLDYPKDTAEGGGQVQVLEGVTGVARKIPLLGGAANLVSKALGVPFKISGSALDPTFRVGLPSPVTGGPNM